MSEDLIIKILEVIVTLAIILITRYIIPWLKSKAFYNNLSSALTLASSYVRYTEQFIQGEKVGEERFQLATTLLTTSCNKLGLGLTEETVGAIIQNAYDSEIGSSDTE